MRIQEYIRQRNEKHRAEIKAMESKIAENADKAEALNIILGISIHTPLAGSDEGR